MPEALAVHTPGGQKPVLGGIVQPGSAHDRFAFNSAGYQNLAVIKQDRRAVAAMLIKAGPWYRTEMCLRRAIKFAADQIVVSAEEKVGTSSPDTSYYQNITPLQQRGVMQRAGD